ncbi:MAG TPA: SPOR domain-containing protein [Blastocatellia bacterium]|nr:SPOR domain-containing protein [Blastocatellia bacterium]
MSSILKAGMAGAIVLTLWLASAVQAQTGSAGITITNQAGATYRDDTGADYQAVSPTVTFTVKPVAGVVVTPDDTQSTGIAAPNDRITRVFRICNAGNTPDAYVLTSAEVAAPSTLAALNYDVNGDGLPGAGDTPVTLNSTVTPVLQPGECIGVLMTVSTGAISSGTALTLTITAKSTATGTANGAPQDKGTIINNVGSAVSLTAPENPSLPPMKLVENKDRVTTTAGSVLNYSVSFRNRGAVPARNVLLADDLPTELDYLPGTLKLGSRALTDADDSDEGRVSGKRFEVRLPLVAPDETVIVTFQGRLNQNVIPGVGVVNTATVSGENIRTTVRTTETVAVINPYGVVYAGYSAGSVRVAGAKVVLSTDREGTIPVTTSATTGFAPNEQNANPFLTDQQGQFNFALSPTQLGTADNPAVYYLNVSAQGWRQRTLEITIRPTANNLYSATIRALDGQPVAQSGGFRLTNVPVTLDNLAALVMNIPVFEPSTLELSKIADRQHIQIGDMISYRAEARNASSIVLSDLTLTDTLPPSFNFIPGTARIQVGSSPAYAIEPAVSGSTLKFIIGQIGAGERVTITYRVRIGANARDGEQVNSIVGSGKYPSGDLITTPPAKAPVIVGQGVFSMRQVIIGRVFEDTNGNGLFDKGERPVAAARVYLDNGTSVITDSQGMFNFPSVEEGATVVSLDPVTVPKGFALHENGLKSGRSWTRMLRTPLGGGGLLRVNFPLLKITSPVSSTVTDLNGGADPEPVEAKNAGRAASAKANPAVENNPRRKTISTGAGLRAGTYERAATENIEPVAPGDLKILSPEPNEVILAPSLSVAARVAMDYTVTLELNGARVSDKNIGVKEIDRKNKVATFVFVSLLARPGRNHLKITAIAPDGTPGRTVEMDVMGPGPAKRIEIVTERNEISAGGRDATTVRIRAFDEWGNPAMSGQVAVEVSAGRLLGRRDETPEVPKHSANLNAPSLAGEGIESASGSQTGAGTRQQIVTIENGEATLQLIGEGAPGNAEIVARAGDVQGRGRVRIMPEVRPQLLVGLAEASFGSAAPDIALRGDDRSYRTHTEFYFKGALPKQVMMTLAYNSFRPLTRTAGRNRVFALDPLDRVYPVFGDSSSRFEDAQSNSKLYARFDRGRSFVMFGDFDVNSDNNTTAWQSQNLSENLASSAIGNQALPANSANFGSGGPQLTGYQRRLTGVKLHLENARGDYLTATGARPDTAFARDVFPGRTFGLVQLSSTDIIQGSETVVLEVRDRRNPEIILSRQTLVRSVDYNLDPDLGVIFFMRPISTFDYALNLVQIVATYEHVAIGLSSAVYTARGAKAFEAAGLRVGSSFVNQRQDQFGPYYLGGVDLEQKLPFSGTLQFEWGMSRGRVASGGNLFFGGTGANTLDQEHNGNAFRAELRQPVNWREGVIQASFLKSDADYLNPFGSTVTPGTQRASIAFDLKPRSRSLMRFGFTDERHHTENFNNSRRTASIGWVESVHDKLRVSFGYDYRSFSDASGTALANAANNAANNPANNAAGSAAAPASFAGREVTSNLITVGAEYTPNDKLQLAVRREQNLSESDPSYPNQTTITAGYRLNSLAKIFFTQRLASQAITPVSDVMATGFGGLSSRRETAVGIETALGRYTSLNTRYQIDNGINGTDSFAVIGLINRLPVSRQISLDLGYERGMHLAGNGQSFNNASLGFTWQPNENFRSAARYELRDLNGFGQILTFGAAGKVTSSLTSLGRFQVARADFQGRGNLTINGIAALAWRPLESDRTALLFSYNHRTFEQSAQRGFDATRDRADIVSTDGLFQATRRLELYGRFALKFSENGRADVPLAATLTMLGQGRAEFRFARYFDLAGEARTLWQPSNSSQRNSLGAELGFWALSDLRFGLGYNFTRATEPTYFGGVSPAGSFTQRRGVYFVISSKLSNMFNLFGTSRDGLVTMDEAQTHEYLAQNFDPKQKEPQHKPRTAEPKPQAKPLMTATEPDEAEAKEKISELPPVQTARTQRTTIIAAQPPVPAVSAIQDAAEVPVKPVVPEVRRNEAGGVILNAMELSFTVQIGSHKRLADARRHAAYLKEFGIEARIVKAEVPGRGLWYRVQSGRFSTLDEAGNYGAKLKEKGALVNFVIADFQTTDPISR